MNVSNHILVFVFMIKHAKRYSSINFMNDQSKKLCQTVIILGQSIIGVKMLGLALFSYTDKTRWPGGLQVWTILLIFPWQLRKIDDKWQAHSTDISTTTLVYLWFYFKVARYSNITMPIRTITLIKNFKNCLKTTIDLLDVMGVTTKSSKNRKSIWNKMELLNSQKGSHLA